MPSLRIILTLIASITLLVSCGSTQSENEQSGETSEQRNIGGYMPLEVGGKFVIRLTCESGLGSYQSEPQSINYFYEYTQTVESPRYGTLYQLEIESGALEETNRYFRFVTDGQYLIVNGIDDEIAEVMLEEPLEVGHSWTTQTMEGNPPSVTREIVSVNESVTVPAGTFSCVHVSTGEYLEDLIDGEFTTDQYGNYHCDGMESTKNDVWFAPGAGWVKSVITHSSTNEHPYWIIITRELIEY